MTLSYREHKFLILKKINGFSKFLKKFLESKITKIIFYKEN